MKSRLLWASGPLVIGCVYLVYVWDRQVVAVEMVEVRKAFDLSLAAGGLIATVFTFGITVGSVPAALLTTRFGTRSMLAVGALLFSLCTAWSAVAPNATIMLLSRVAGGFGEAIFSVALYTFLASQAPRYKGAAAGAAATVFGIGLFTGPLIVAALLSRSTTWQGPFYVLSALGMAGGIAIWLVLPRRPGVAVVPIRPRPVTLSRVSRVLKGGTASLLPVVAVNGIAIYSFIALFQTFLRENQAMALSGASLVVSLFGVGQLFGGAPMGYLADRVGRRRYLAAAAIVTAGAGYAVFGSLTPLTWGMAAFVFGLGTNSIYANCIALAQEGVPDDDHALATGLLATVYFLPAAFSGWMLAELKEALGWHGAGMLLYTVPFLVMSIALAITGGTRRASLTG